MEPARPKPEEEALQERGQIARRMFWNGHRGASARPPAAEQRTAETDRKSAFRLLPAAFLAALLAGCQTPALPQPRLAPPEWQRRSGQFAWMPERGGAEIVADFDLWFTPSGRCWMEVSKAGLPFLTVQLERDAWRIKAAAAGRSLSRKGEATAGAGWLQLARCLGGGRPAPGWRWQTGADGAWVLEHASTGEHMEGFFLP